MAVLVLAAGCSQAAPHTASSGQDGTLPTTTTTGEDDLSAAGAPTIHGSVVGAGSGSAVGNSACRGGNPLANVYHPNRLLVLAACDTVSGTVESVRSEDDGDTHFDLALDPQYRSMLTSANSSEQHGWLVVEIVPADEPGCTPGAAPKPPSGSYDYGICTGADEVAPTVGSHVYVTGPYVLDEDHGGWAEIHPVWAISSSPPAATPGPTPSTTAAPSPTAVAAPPPAPVPSPTPTCSASMSDPTPGTSGEETLSVSSDLPDASGTATAHYKTTDHPFPFQTDASGRASVTFSIGHPTAGYTVQVDVVITGGASCSTSFTPQ
ncbi:MAG TPA: hypothetical protein VE991_12605 [Acidimicrobiales bacterium]|nr:hypothetical protein [Acidimicrobiales bacterium]